MTGNDSGNAMTEIALALAMAFFAIMILTMVSMGGQAGATTPTKAKLPADDLHLVPSSEHQTGTQVANDARAVAPRQLIIFSEGRFLDEQLQPLETAVMAAMAQPVMAVPPNLSLAEVMAVKGRLALANLTITTLTQAWLDAIKEHAK
ncbi:MAG: hypothetical protein HN394_10540 [Rhodospirillaceae bacterium]|nr:hypothetical protein [Rhodospirillaceae bacterium]